MKKLKEPEHTLPPPVAGRRRSGDGLGPLLFQLPPPGGLTLHGSRPLPPLCRRGLSRLRAARVSLAERRRPDLLWWHNAAFCIYDLAGCTYPRAITDDFAYLRMPGPGAAYSGRHRRRVLAGGAQWLGAQTVATAHV